jgi:hypothetical protein
MEMTMLSTEVEQLPLNRLIDTFNEPCGQIDCRFTTNQVNDSWCPQHHRLQREIARRQRVWMLASTFGYPECRKWQDRWSEENIWYVAVTRARERLCIVGTEIPDIMNPDRPRKRQVRWR